MKKLKIILQYNYLFYILLFFSLIYSFLFINLININSNYINKKCIKGIIVSKNIDGDKLELIIKNKEKILVNYYFESKKEKNDFNLNYGDYACIYGKSSTPKNNTNFNLFNYKKYLLSEKIYIIYNANKIIKIKNNSNFFYLIKNMIDNRINKCKKTKEYINAFVLGNKKYIDYNVKKEYQNLGVSHLFSISGMHIGLISSIILLLLKNIDENVRHFIVNSFLIIYMFLTGFSPSVIRTVFLFIFITINKLLNLNIKTINLLILLFSLLLIYNPYFIYNIGFIFSFSICFSLILFSEKISLYNKYIYKTMYISSLCFFVSLPIVINNFFQVNLLSIFYNLIYVPLISFIVFPFGLITFFIPSFDSLYYYIIVFLELITKIISKFSVILYFAKIPIILIIIYYIILFINISYPNIKRKMVLIFLIIILYNFNRIVKFELIFIDVGQGDSSLIRINDKNLMIDTGGKVSFNNDKWKKRNNDTSLSNTTLLPLLKSVGVKKIDYLILTHGDYDHMGEAINLVNNFKVEKVIFNCGPYNDLEKELIKLLDKKKIKYYSCIKELNIDDNKLYFLQTKEYDNENDNSSVIYTELNGYKFMFMGDASSATEKEILDKYNLPDIDVLKVGHHGSKTSSSIEFIDEINPNYSVISVGKKNRYGHPNKEVLENLKDSKIYRTDKDGSIMFKIKNNKLKIETCSP